MDVSDGLAGDLAKMLRVSGVTGWVDAEAVPLSDATRRAVGVEPRLMDRALTGGDDYEILCTCPKDRIDSLVEEADKAGVPVTVIGQVLAGEGLPAFRSGATERRFETGSFSHF
jgi:thiamine-monophosphate kinase